MGGIQGRKGPRGARDQAGKGLEAASVALIVNHTDTHRVWLWLHILTRSTVPQDDDCRRVKSDVTTHVSLSAEGWGRS